MESRYRDWLPTVLAALAFIGFLTAFAWELFAYQRKVVAWAQRDLQSRADLAAAHLDEPLRTQDFRKIHAFGDSVRADGYRLSVLDANGRGRVFDTYRNQDGGRLRFYADQRCGEYIVRLWIPTQQVFKPFLRALVGIALAGLVGIAGVLLFFFVTYRQRVHIRELKRLEEFRREFIADFSHELKTPLTGIIGAVELLEGNDRLVDMIKRESGRLNRLAQGVLDLARLERVGDFVKRQSVDLAELVCEISAEFGCKARVGGVCFVNCDKDMIAQAIGNLIVNAQRHSGSSEISVGLRRERKRVIIEVEDHGIGIPETEYEHIFERFHRLDSARAAESGGAGLGLAIVRRIARLHGGEASYSPVKPHGSVFSISIPVSN